MNWLKCLGRWVLGWDTTTNRKKEKAVCDGGVAGSSCCTNVEATLRGKSQELIDLARYLEMGVRQTLCWVAGATATEGDNPKVKTEYDICEIVVEDLNKLAGMVPEGLAEARVRAVKLEIVTKDLISGLRRAQALRDDVKKTLHHQKQVKMLKKERHMDLKLLEGATHKINTLRQKMVELKEELRLLSPAKKKTKVNRPGTPAPRGPPTSAKTIPGTPAPSGPPSSAEKMPGTPAPSGPPSSAEKMPGTPAPSGPPPSADTRPQGVRGGGINDGWAASSGKTPKAKLELNIWAAILEVEGNRSREGGAQSGVSRGATGFRV